MPRGKKACSSCGELTGPRTLKCKKCGQAFEAKPKEVEPDKVEQPKTQPQPRLAKIAARKTAKAPSQAADPFRPVVDVPSGVVPAEFNSTIFRNLMIDWVGRIVEAESGKILTDHAIQQYARQYFDITGPHFRKIAKIITEVCDEEYPTQVKGTIKNG